MEFDWRDENIDGESTDLTWTQRRPAQNVYESTEGEAHARATVLALDFDFAIEYSTVQVIATSSASPSLESASAEWPRCLATGTHMPNNDNRTLHLILAK